MNQTNHFFNLGYGWLCKHCSAEKAARPSDNIRPGHFSRDHVAGKSAARRAELASWTDATRQALKCPRCGIEEMVN